MKQGSLAVLVVIVALGGGARSAHAGSDVHFTLGWTQMQDGSWQDASTQGVLGIGVLAGPDDWPVRIAGGVRSSSSLALFGDDMSMREYGIGVAKVFQPKTSARPFVGGGVAMCDGSGEVVQPGPDNNVHVSGSSLGAYVDAGVFWRLGKHFDIGVDAHGIFGTSVSARTTSGTMLTASADNAGLGLILGFGW